MGEIWQTTLKYDMRMATISRSPLIMVIFSWPNRRRCSLAGGIGIACLMLSLIPLTVHALSNGQSATVSLGYIGANALNIDEPKGVATDSSGNVWVADTIHNRIVEFLKGNGFTKGEAPAVVLGQVDFKHNAASPTATGLSQPEGIGFDHSGNL